MKKTNPKINLNWIEGQPTRRYERFHRFTKWRNLTPAIPHKNWPEAWKTTYFKEYPRLDKVILPDVDLTKYQNKKYLETQFNRRSLRQFSPEPLTLSEISHFLYLSAGLRINKAPYMGNRFYPSPGGRYSLETYILSLNSDLPKGWYHYNLKEHYLEVLDLFEDFDFDQYFHQDCPTGGSIMVVVSAVFFRNIVKYGERGYRHVLLETGHLGQNFYLTTSLQNLAGCAVGGYSDFKLEESLDLDGVNESIVYVYALGNLVPTK